MCACSHIAKSEVMTQSVKPHMYNFDGFYGSSSEEAIKKEEKRYEDFVALSSFTSVQHAVKAYLVGGTLCSVRVASCKVPLLSLDNFNNY